jgi:hypothetical protein
MVYWAYKYWINDCGSYDKKFIDKESIKSCRVCKTH